MTVKPGWARKGRTAARTLPAKEKPEWARAPWPPRPLWRLDRSEQRVLFVTFLAGVASIVVAAFFIGLAIGLGNIYTALSKHHAWGILTDAEKVNAIIGGIAAVFAIGALLLAWFAMSNPKESAARRVTLRIVWVFVAAAGLLLVVMMLTVIGLAARNH